MMPLLTTHMHPTQMADSTSEARSHIHISSSTSSIVFVRVLIHSPPCIASFHAFDHKPGAQFFIARMHSSCDPPLFDVGIRKADSKRRRCLIALSYK